MQSREPRFSLRFESGAREGEQVPLASDISTVGRRSENTIVISHASVSGRHAALSVEDGNLILADSGSTNGTRVNDEKIERVQLKVGDSITFGSVRAVLEDGDVTSQLDPRAGMADEVFLVDDGDEMVIEEPVLEAPASPTARAADLADTAFTDAPIPRDPAASGDADSTLGRFSTERLAATGSRSKLGLIALLVVVLAGGGAAGWLHFQKGAAEDAGEAIADVPGNVLDDFSFEDSEAPTWLSAEAAPQVFSVDSAFANRGRAGLGAVLETDEWAFASSATFRIPAGKAVELHATLEVRDQALGRVGVELTQSTASRGFTAPPLIAWAPAQAATDGFADVLLKFDALPGYDTGCVVVAGKAQGGAGDLSLDDVSVVIAGSGSGPTVTFEDYELHVLGNPGSTAAILRSGSVLFSSVALSDWSAAGLTGDAMARWTGLASKNGFELTAVDGSGSATCTIVSCGGRALAPDDSSAPWLSTVGPGGYRSHATTFERKRASDLLTGGGINLLRFGTAGEVPMSSVMVGESARFQIGMGGQQTLEMQLQFRAEREQANELARRARTQEKDAAFGAAIGTWSELLDRFPFDAKLIAEAEETRARLTQMGSEQVDNVRHEIERAAFFELADLYRDCRAQAQAVAVGFEGSEIEPAALALVAQVNAELAVLSSGRAGGVVERLQGVLEAIGQAENPTLAEHLKKAIAAKQALGAEEGQ